ncbi:heterokaryon incompatibility protein-domain-containing protein [Phaeosphaeria sp. MPI-PUGE-AT-0046c]|nr:heterokaryon incompatibility protein-domain-containing protein [Phaeosphaeria sp. MPI-PUGE-AT-0046c]
MAPNRLCSRCQAIFDTELNPKDPFQGTTDFDHYDDGDAFIKLAETTLCYFCTWVWRRYRDSVGVTGGRRPEVHHTSGQFYTYDGELTRIFFDVHGTDNSSRTIAEFKPKKQDTSSTHLGFYRPSLRASVDFQQARAWLQDCDLNHAECQGWRKHRTLPSRLVHVRRAEKGSDILANICHGEGLPATTTYLSLSHCWGKSKFITTTRENLPQFELQLPVGSLSRTIQDAMLVTLEMGFKYIWIDSLCIIQDSAEDWAREALLMGEVYQNASCNISASGFSNGKHGFISPRAFDPAPVSAQVKWAMAQQQNFGMSPTETYSFIFDNPRTEIYHAPLFQRAWTLQEQLLASRALHFGTDQMFWECSRSLANEVWPQGWEGKGKPFTHNFTSFSQLWQFGIDSLPASRESCYRIWRNIVVAYTHRNVTFESDWLPALAGLASRFTSVLEDTNVHGMWKRNLHHEILYNQEGTEGVGFTPHDSRVTPNWEELPSWSWAALHKPVRWDTKDVHNRRQLCSLELVNTEGTPMLRLIGMLIPLISNEFSKMRISYAASTFVGNKQSGLRISMSPDEWLLSEIWDDLKLSGDADAEDTHNRVLDALRTSVIFMPVLLSTFASRSVKGVLLCKRPNLKHGQYRRAGVASMNSSISAEKWWTKQFIYERTMGELREYVQALVDPDVHEMSDDGQYVITVV